MDHREIVMSFFASWGVQDVELAVEHFHEDIVYEIHVTAAELPFGRLTRGKAGCRDAMFSILRDFDYLKYEPTINSIDGDTVRAHVAFKYRHRPTGETLEGTRRLVFRLKDGLILRIDGYHDARLFETFLRLARNREASNQLATIPKLPGAAARVRPR
jgi:ketosteroid isomerase-like protein